MALTVSSCVEAKPREGEAQFRELYKELIETDTSLSSGSCTLAAERMQARLIQAGFADTEARVVVPDSFLKQGNLVVHFEGENKALKPVLFMAHIDVVEAKRSDWERDPFTLYEENGYFYARGAVDDKAMASSFVDAFVRFKKAGFKPQRTMKLALTCGEETDSIFNGIQYLLAKQPEALQAEWAINEGGKGALDSDGNFVSFGVQSGEKIYQDFTLVTTAPGGHSARPVDDNAINRLSAALVRIGDYKFPVDLTPASKGFFGRSAVLWDGERKADMAAIGAGTADAAVYNRIAKANPLWNAFLRTTCISTLVKGGHAPNAQPQHVEANINCRIIPGESIDAIKAQLEKLINDPLIEVSLADAPGPQSDAPPLSPKIMEPIETITADMWPNVPVIPTLSSGATDGRFLNAAGIPTYGVSGVFVNPDGNGVHGLNERIRVRSLLDARDFLYRLMKSYAVTE
ncbi:M20/M25/M40 family metallo-hydrolase [Kordiimonas pumila]